VLLAVTVLLRLFEAEALSFDVVSVEVELEQANRTQSEKISKKLL
jgi:hypothetical protein